MAQAPEVLLDLIARAETKQIAPSGAVQYTDDKQTQDRFVQYLKTAPIAIEGESGEKVTFSVAAVGHDLALHPDISFDLMLKYYNNN